MKSIDGEVYRRIRRHLIQSGEKFKQTPYSNIVCLSDHADPTPSSPSLVLSSKSNSELQPDIKLIDSAPHPTPYVTRYGTTVKPNIFVFVLMP